MTQNEIPTSKMQEARINYGVYIDTFNRLIGMNYSIARYDTGTNQYSDADLISYVVRGV